MDKTKMTYEELEEAYMRTLQELENTKIENYKLQDLIEEMEIKKLNKNNRSVAQVHADYVAKFKKFDRLVTMLYHENEELIAENKKLKTSIDAIQDEANKQQQAIAMLNEYFNITLESAQKLIDKVNKSQD